MSGRFRPRRTFRTTPVPTDLEIYLPFFHNTGVKRMSMNYSGHWRRMLASMALVLFGATAAMAQWTPVGSVAEPLHAAAQTYLDGKLYTFGGYVGNSYVMQGEKLDVSTAGNNWTPTA